MKKIIVAILLIVCVTGFAQKTKPFFGKQDGMITFEKKVYRVDSFIVNTVRLSKESQQVITNYHKNKNLQKFGYSLNELETNINDSYKKVARKEKNPFNSFFDKYMSDLESLILFPEYEVYKAEILEYKRIYNLQKRQKSIIDSLDVVKKNSEKEKATYLTKKRLREASMRQWSSANAGHEYLTVFHGFELNFVKEMLSEFLDQYLKMGLLDDNFEGDSETMLYATTGGGTPDNIIVQYFFSSNEYGYYIVDNVLIKGDFKSLAYLFISYWPTKININDVKKDEWAYYYQMPDRVSFLVDKNANAKIIIEKAP